MKGEDKRMADRIHSIRKTLRLKPSEAKALSDKSKEAGLCEAEFLRFLLSQKPYDHPEIRLVVKGLINEVNAIGNNINQITKNNNSGLYIQSDKELLNAYMKKLNMLVKEVVDMIGNQ